MIWSVLISAFITSKTWSKVRICLARNGEKGGRKVRKLLDLRKLSQFTFWIWNKFSVNKLEWTLMHAAVWRLQQKISKFKNTFETSQLLCKFLKRERGDEDGEVAKFHNSRVSRCGVLNSAGNPFDPQMIWLISHIDPNNLTEFCIDPKHKMSHNILIFCTIHFTLMQLEQDHIEHCDDFAEQTTATIVSLC